LPFAEPPVECHAGVLYWTRIGKTKTWIAAKYGLTVGQVSYVVAVARAHGEAVAAAPGQGGIVVPFRRRAFAPDRSISATVMPLLSRGVGRCAWVLGPVEGAATLCCGALVARSTRDKPLPYCLTHWCAATRVSR
jgi:hypothetical protein